MTALTILLLLPLLTGCARDYESVSLTSSSSTSSVASSADSQLSSEQRVAGAAERISRAVGIPIEAIEVAVGEAMLATADTAFRWEGGLAEVDSNSGRIVMISNRAKPAEPRADVPTGGDLAGEVDVLLALLGWDDAALESGHFSLETPVLELTTGGCRQSWIGHTEAGILNGSRIDICVDAEDAALRGFAFHPGAGEVEGDASGAISEERAVQIAYDLIIGAALPLASAGAGKPLEASDISLELKEVTLTWTNAPAVTGGKTMLIWRIRLVGTDPSGACAGGAVYLDARTGQVLQQLSL